MEDRRQRNESAECDCTDTGFLHVEGFGPACANREYTLEMVLRDALKKAPHPNECSMRVGDGLDACDCWHSHARIALDEKEGA